MIFLSPKKPATARIGSDQGQYVRIRARARLSHDCASVAAGGFVLAAGPLLAGERSLETLDVELLAAEDGAAPESELWSLTVSEVVGDGPWVEFPVSEGGGGGDPLWEGGVFDGGCELGG
jgi:hypothetical protein